MFRDRLTFSVENVNKNMFGEYHNGENRRKLGIAVFKTVQLNPGTSEKGTEKDLRYLYQEPALVPWVRSPR